MPERGKTATARAVPRRTRISKVGVVVSVRMRKTAVVAVQRLVRHPEYKRIVRRTSRFLAHDGRDEARVGDRVEIVETRPLSRRKRWRIARIIARAPGRMRESAEADDAVLEEIGS